MRGAFLTSLVGAGGHTEPTDDHQPQGGEQRDCALPDATHGALGSPRGVLAAHHPAPLLNWSSVRPLIPITSSYRGRLEIGPLLSDTTGAISQIQTVGQMTQFLQINGLRKGDGQVTEDLLTDSKSLEATCSVWV